MQPYYIAENERIVAEEDQWVLEKEVKEKGHMVWRGRKYFSSLRGLESFMIRYYVTKSEDEMIPAFEDAAQRVRILRTAISLADPSQGIG